MNSLLDVINKQRRVHGLMQHQSMHKHEVASSLLQRQQDAELASHITLTTAEQIAQCLSALDTPSAQRLWQLIPPEQANRVLWSLPEIRRMELNLESPAVDHQRIQCYELSNGRLVSVSLQDSSVLKNHAPVWVDLIDVTLGERRFIETLFQVKLPELLDENELEVTARFQVSDDDDLMLHSNFLGIQAQHARSVPVAFMVHHGMLFSIRREPLPIFDLQKQRSRNQPGYVNDAWDVLIDLYAADVECSADALENIYGKLGQVGRHVLSESISDQMAAGILSDIAEEEDHNGRIRSNILDTQRALNFLLRGRLLSENQIQDCRQIQRNIESLNSHTSFLFDKINFLMDSTIGFININQNKRVNQLTIFSVVFMPINILAGIGGMSEFSMMTQGIDWPLAYGGFVVCSAFIGWITYRVLGLLERKRALSSYRRPTH
ncbi:MAG: magnesium transporter CorA [Limnohabitans sp.]|nr:magnesium transporter CorA [Limnohabitans sp.]